MKRHRILTSVFSAALVFGGLSFAKDPADPSAGVIVLRHCLLDFKEASTFGSAFSLPLENCLVRLGDKVKAGQILGRLDDFDIRSEIDLISATIDSDIDRRSAKAEYEQALAKYRKSQELHKRKYVSPEELSLDQLLVEKTRLAMENTEHQRKLNEIKRRRLTSDLRQRAFVAAHDGTVVEVNKVQGEMVMLNEVVFKVANTNRLRVNGLLNVSDIWAVRPGQQVRVATEIGGVDLAVEREIFQGEIVFIDHNVNHETQTCKVIAEVNNRDNLLRAGLEVRMEILPGDPAAAAKPGVEGTKVGTSKPATNPPGPQERGSSSDATKKTTSAAYATTTETVEK